MNRPNKTFFKATTKQLKEEVFLEKLGAALIELGIDNQYKLSLAKKTKALIIPKYHIIDKTCFSVTGFSFDEFFNFKNSVTKTKSAKTKPAKTKRIDKILQPEFIKGFKQWCSENSIKSVNDYIASKIRPKEFPTHTTITKNYGYDYFTEVIGLKRYKDTLEDKLLDDKFTSSLKNWCIENDITSQGKYTKTPKPKSFPSVERIRQILGNGYFEQILEIKARHFLSKEDARQVCIDNGILTSNSYREFYQRYNDINGIKLPSNPYGVYQTNWPNFIALSETQLFIGNSMSSLELFTYKLLYDRGIQFETEKTFENCKSKNLLPFDFFLPSVACKRIIIELDGEQHRTTDENSLFYSKATEKHDKIKNEYCFANEIDLIRINKITDIEPTLNERIGLNTFPQIKDLDWTKDFDTENEVINSKLSKSLKAKLLLLMSERGKSILTNVEIISKTKIKKNQFYVLKNELIALGLINRPNEYHFTEAELDNITNLYKQGKSISQIVKETGYKNRTYLVKRLKNANVGYVSSKPSKEDVLETRRQVITLFDQGLKVKDIAEKAKRSSSSISILIKDIKLERGELKLTAEEIELGNVIRQRIHEGKTLQHIASEIRTSKTHLHNILNWTKYHTNN